MSDSVRMVSTKWGGIPHWERPARRIGEDDFGTWLLIDAGVTLSRPGRTLISRVRSVSVISAELPYIPSFYATWEAPTADVLSAIYVDMTTLPVWDGDTVTSVDLDLDVVLRQSGEIHILDEDEFAEHQVSFGYPDHIVTLAQRTCDQVLADLTAKVEPYATVGWDWLKRA